MILHQQMERKNHLVSCSHAERSRAIEEYVWVNYEQTVNVKKKIVNGKQVLCLFTFNLHDQGHSNNSMIVKYCFQ